MSQTPAGDDVGARDCPARALVERIGQKWSVLVLAELADGRPHRFAELRGHLDGVSEKMLAQTLRNLEQDGLVRREAFPEVPPRVEYRLTSLGFTLRAPLQALRDWSIDHADDVLAARQDYAARAARSR